jgi:hypothetical protein
MKMSAPISFNRMTASDRDFDNESPLSGHEFSSDRFRLTNSG